MRKAVSEDTEKKESEILSLPDGDGGDCTVWFALGRAAKGNTYIAKNNEFEERYFIWERYVDGCCEGVIEVIAPEDGNRYLGVRQFSGEAHPGNPDMNPGINDKGVGSFNARRRSYERQADPAENSLYYRTGEVLRKANSAREAVELAVAIEKEGGMGPTRGNG